MAALPPLVPPLNLRPGPPVADVDFWVPQVLPGVIPTPLPAGLVPNQQLQANLFTPAQGQLIINAWLGGPNPPLRVFPAGHLYAGTEERTGG